MTPTPTDLRADVIDVVARPVHDSVARPRPDALAATGPIVPNWAFLRAHPAHAIALGFGAGLSRMAPGTAGTLWAWAAFLILQHLGVTEAGWGYVIAASLPLGWWACTVTARHMQVQDPGSIVWDEVVAFWIVLWLVMPAGFWSQLAAFALFRYFDAAKPGPVGWADRLFHDADPSRDAYAWPKAGLGIMLDDLAAAACTLLAIAIWRFA
jgi:phosphatidylglycerophosphatase A